jgi:hypothetical protein
MSLRLPERDSNRTRVYAARLGPSAVPSDQTDKGRAAAYPATCARAAALKT